jgi:hypothetical protein
MYRMSPWRGQELEQEFRMAQESRAKLTVSGAKEEAGSPEVREGPQG